MRFIAPLLVALTACPGAAQEPEREPRRPNVVVILADDAGFADFSIQGSELCATPHIDSIARDGLSFQQAYACSSICGPSRAGLITGRYQHRYGFEYNVPNTGNRGAGLATSEVTLADALGELGYHSACIGKWHLGWADSFHPLSRGFDHFYGFLGGARKYVPQPGGKFDQRMQLGREDAPEEFAYLTDELGSAAARYIDEHAEDPFFLFLSFSAVHVPLQAPDDLLEENAAIEDVRRRKLVAMTAALDRAVGEVLAKLDELELRDDTLVLFLNDNGGSEKNAASNSPLRGFKGEPYEGGVRVPFFARWPARLEAGLVYSEPVSLLDVLPTVVAAAGGEVPAGLDGVDLWPFVEGRSAGRPHETLFWRRGSSWAARSVDWKAVSIDGEAAQLFDLAQDPRETADLASAHPKIVEELRAKLAAWAEPMAVPRWRKFLHDDD